MQLEDVGRLRERAQGTVLPRAHRIPCKKVTTTTQTHGDAQGVCQEVLQVDTVNHQHEEDRLFFLDGLQP